MSCGQTPDLTRMLEHMAVEKERHAEEAQQNVIQAQQHCARVKSKVAKVQDKHHQQQQQDGFDWTRTYEKWDAWEDPEELVRKEQEARERSERAAKAQSGCNHDHSAEQRVMDMTTHAKLTACDEFRGLGNLFYHHGQYQRAAFHYNKALVYFEYVFPETEDEEVQADALKLKLLVNFAACRVKTRHVEDAVHHANQALELDPTSVKSLYWRALAYRLKDEFDLAQQDLERATALLSTHVHTTMPSLQLLLWQETKLLQAQKLAYKLRTKQLSAVMFGSRAKHQANERVDSGDERCSHAPARALDLSETVNEIDDDATCFDSAQPIRRGLTELQTLVKSFVHAGPHDRNSSL